MDEPNGPETAAIADENAPQDSSQLTQGVDEQVIPPVTPFEALQAHLKEYPHDAAAWQDLVNMVEESGDFKLVHDAYDALLKVYPNTVRAQVPYLRHSQRAFPVGRPKAPDSDPIPTPQTLFSQWLKQSPDVELWKLYLDYVRANQASPRDTIKKAYEFALRFVGQDRDAGDIWKDYIEYIKADPATTDREGQEKMDLLRSVYRRAVQIPLDNLEQLWREWDSFENSLNKLTAKKFLADVSPDYMMARTKKTELADHHKRIHLYNHAIYSERPPLDLPTPSILHPEERALLANWRKYLEFEEGNPLEIAEKSMLNARLLTIYRKAVIRMRFYPEIWYLAYLWSSSIGKAEDAQAFLKNGVEANPTSFLLNFAYAEYQEQAMLSLQPAAGSDPKKVDEKKLEIYDIYRKFSALLKADLEQIEENHVAQGGNPISLQPGGAQQKAPVAPAPINIEDDITMKENEIYGVIDPAVIEAKEKEKERQQENERIEALLIAKRIELGQVFIAWLRYAKRVGHSAGLRNAFKEIRADKWISWQVFEATANLEHQIAPTADVAAKIFELGLRSFGNDVDYVVRYLNFLTNKGDEANARVLFEKTIGTFEAEKARPLWQRWLMYQMNYADLPTIHKLDKRVAEVYPGERVMKLFAQRYTYLGGEVVPPPFGIDPIASHDLQTAPRIPSVFPPPNVSLVPVPLASQQPPPQNFAPNGPSHSYAQHPPVGAAPPTGPAAGRGPPPMRHSPGQPPKRPLPDMDPSGSMKRARRSPPPARRPPPQAHRRWGSPPRDDPRRGRGRSPEPGLPPSVAWLLSHLPNAASYDGPLFKMDEFLGILARTALPPPRGGGRSRSPPPRGGRGMPDYGPYQGPGPRGGRR